MVLADCDYRPQLDYAVDTQTSPFDRSMLLVAAAFETTRTCFPTTTTRTLVDYSTTHRSTQCGYYLPHATLLVFVVETLVGEIAMELAGLVVVSWALAVSCEMSVDAGDRLALAWQLAQPSVLFSLSQLSTRLYHLK